MRTAAISLAVVTVSVNAAAAPALYPATLDGITSAAGIRHWVELAEPGNMGLLLMGIAGLLIGRWAARKKSDDRSDDGSR